MKDKYTGYPEIKATRYDMLFDEQQYYHQFYNDREFHVKRIQKGKTIMATTLGKMALETVVLGACALGVILHGNSMFNDVFSQTINSGALLVDLTAIITSIGFVSAAAYLLKDNAVLLKHAGIDLNVSKKMLERLSEKSGYEYTNSDVNSSANNMQEDQGGIKK